MFDYILDYVSGKNEEEQQVPTGKEIDLVEVLHPPSLNSWLVEERQGEMSEGERASLGSS